MASAANLWQHCAGSLRREGGRCTNWHTSNLTLQPWSGTTKAHKFQRRYPLSTFGITRSSLNSLPTTSPGVRADHSQENPNAEEEEVLLDLIKWLQRELPKLFEEGGMSSDRFADHVDFEDPITRYDNINGYLFNIALLRVLFSPIFILHDAYISGPTELTTRWTMRMFFRLLPWVPEVVFTGTSIYGVDLTSRKFVSHKDVWDSVRNNAYFSQEGLQDLLRQLLLPYLAPARLGSPPFTSLVRRADFEVRRYEPFSVVQVPLPGTTSHSAPAPSWPPEGAIADGRRRLKSLAKGAQGPRLSEPPGPVALSSAPLSSLLAAASPSDQEPGSSAQQWLATAVNPTAAGSPPSSPAPSPVQLSAFIAVAAAYAGPPTAEGFKNCAQQLRKQLSGDAAVLTALGDADVASLQEVHLSYEMESLPLMPRIFIRNEVLILLPNFQLEKLK